VGVAIAAVIAVATLGIDLTNLAVIIGALSVGIGLGLQETVKNFMAGLTMLIERPIRVGDKVTVGPHTGFVRRIKVRATEIETFDRGSVIVPNAELLSHTVLNWTHRDSLGRVLIPISVAVGTDVPKAQKILFSCAAKHPEVLEKPKPEILLHGFGDNSIDFEMRVYMRDNVLIDNVASDIRYAVEAAFRKSGVKGPVPKREVGLRKLDEPKRPRPNIRIVSDKDRPDDEKE
jgi:small-conductance mechanosensitive channel